MPLRERVTFEFPVPHGGVKKVEFTKKWMEKMEREGKMQRGSSLTVKVNILDPMGGVTPAEFDGPDDLFDALVEPGEEHRVEYWVLGEQVSKEQCQTFLDPDTKELYALTTYEDGKPCTHLIRRCLWERAREAGRPLHPLVSAHQSARNKEALRPDYGSHLVRRGVNKGTLHFFYSVPIAHISLVGSGLFTTLLNLERDGVEYAVSFDFDMNLMATVIALAPIHTQHEIMLGLSKNTGQPYTIELSEPFTIGIEARLGQLQTGKCEEFMPLVVQNVFASK